MVLIADGGSTKCDWAVLDTVGETVLSTQTLGLNPAVLPASTLRDRLRASAPLMEMAHKIEAIYFYGAGCGTQQASNLLAAALGEAFPRAAISVQEDLAAAVHAVTSRPGIVCILGTGSNSCYFDGTKIHPGPPSLGYIVMDEGSGNYFGKKLLTDFYYKRMPLPISEAFQAQHDLSPNTVKRHLYKEPHPNAYLASLGAFMFTDAESPYFRNLIEEGMHRFIENHVLCFEQAQQLPVHFIGSVAKLAAPILATCLRQHSLHLGTVLQRPIEGLATYYKQKLSA